MDPVGLSGGKITTSSLGGRPAGAAAKRPAPRRPAGVSVKRRIRTPFTPKRRPALPLVAIGSRK